ncbi:hypothetical protein [Anaerovibrio sp.]|uniref:hypothetical protein n=1 Tax=Anaerovibrio sp. TaxID=1872532 RepID=UPI0025C1D368|nr:hypothetical protein [Anaerovibrio sp.]MBR2143825.1 hypothetical protein [Anaerovibrio sp.]
MKIKTLCILGTILSIFFINNISCYAVRSEIFESRKVYSSDLYDVYVQTNLIENELVNFYSNRKIEMQIIKKVKSNSYTEHIKDVIREYYRPPLWKPEGLNAKIDAAKAGDALWIKEDIYMDFRNRSITILDESLWSTEEKEHLIIGIPTEATLHTDYSYIDMDNSPEYGSVANASIDFLESIKDIYFDANKGKEYELNIIRTTNFDYYWNRMENKWERANVKIAKDKRTFTDFVDIFIDAKSIMRVGSYYEGWIHLVYDLDKLSKKAKEKGKSINDIWENSPVETYYYIRYDYKNKRFLILAAYERLMDRSTKKYVLSKPEFWTYEEQPDIVATVLDQAADIINNHRSYWG